MPSTTLTQYLPYRAEELMAMVVDVERYPEFINIISAIRVLGARQKTENGEQFEADMRIAYKFLAERVRCTVNMTYPSESQAGTIAVRKSGRDGALRKLTNDWLFISLSSGATFLKFDVDVVLKSAPLNFLARQNFDMVSTRMMQKFLDRAAHICETVECDEAADRAELAQRLSEMGLGGMGLSEMSLS